MELPLCCPLPCSARLSRLLFVLTCLGALRPWPCRTLRDGCCPLMVTSTMFSATAIASHGHSSATVTSTINTTLTTVRDPETGSLGPKVSKTGFTATLRCHTIWTPPRLRHLLQQLIALLQEKKQAWDAKCLVAIRDDLYSMRSFSGFHPGMSASVTIKLPRCHAYCERFDTW